MASPLAEAHKEAQTRIRTGTARAVGQVWKELGSYDRSDVNRYVLAVTPIIEGGKRQAVATATSFIGRSVQKPAPLVDTERIVRETRRGVPESEVQRRPFVATWTALKDEKPWPKAVDEGLTYAVEAAFTDVSLAMRDGLHAAMLAEPTIWGYQRVPGPTACSYCVLASSQMYHREALMPLHARCRCGVDPVEGGPDPTAKYGPTIINDATYARMSGPGTSLTTEITEARRARRYAKQAESNRARAAATRREAALESNPKRAAVLEGRARNWDQRASRQDLQALQARADRIRSKRKVEVAVEEHGELGPVLVNAKHNFTRL